MLTAFVAVSMLAPHPQRPQLMPSLTGALYQEHKVSQTGGCASTWWVQTAGKKPVQVNLSPLAHRALVEGGQELPAKVNLVGTFDGETFQATRLANITRSMLVDAERYPELQGVFPKNMERPAPVANPDEPRMNGVDQPETRSYLNIGVKFSDASGPEPHPASWYTMMLGDTYPGVNHYYQNASYGKLNLNGSQGVAWVTLPGTANSYKLGGSFQAHLLINAAIAAADLDVNRYWGVNVWPVVDDNSGFSYATWATLDLPGGNTAYRPVTMNNPWADQWVMVHEMGHDFAFDHSSTGSEVYNSEWSPMGNGGRYRSNVSGDYGMIANQHNVYHKMHAGWLARNQTITVTPGHQKTVTLQRNGSPGTGKVAAKLLVPGTSDRYYTIEARKHETYDTAASTWGEGIIIHQIDRSQEWDPGASRLIDGDNDGDTSDAETLWTPGETYTGEAGVTVEVLSSTTEGFNVRLTSPAGPTPPGVVTNTNDAGPGSLREALNFLHLVGGNWTVTFNIPITDPNFVNGVFRIRPVTELPAILSSDNQIQGGSQTKATGNTNLKGPEIYIDGSLLTAYAHGLNLHGEFGFENPTNGNIIRGIALGNFTGNGIEIDGGDNNVVGGCQFGLAPDGTTPAPIGNVGVGLWWHARGNQIGGPNATDRNIFGYAFAAVVIHGPLTSDNRVQGNWIGYGADGASPAPHSIGIFTRDGAQGTRVIDNFVGYCDQPAFAVIGADVNDTRFERNTVGISPVDGLVAPVLAGFYLVGSTNTTIGGFTPENGNVLLNAAGVGIFGDSASNTLIQNNFLGRTRNNPAVRSLTSPIVILNDPNIAIRGNFVRGAGNGILLQSCSGSVGGGRANAGNTIVQNTGAGVSITGTSTILVRRNSIRDNGGLAIDWGGDGVTGNDAGDVDQVTNFPTVTFVGAGTKISATATFSGKPNRTYAIDFYGVKTPDPSGFGEADVWLGTRQVTTDEFGNGVVTHSVGEGASFTQVAATATDLTTNQTGELGPITTGLPVPILTTLDRAGEVGEVIQLKGTLTNRQNGLALSNRMLKFYVNGVFVGQSKTDANGEAVKNFTIPSGLPAVTEIRVEWEGNVAHAPNTAVAILSGPVS